MVQSGANGPEQEGSSPATKAGCVAYFLSLWSGAISPSARSATEAWVSCEIAGTCSWPGTPRQSVDNDSWFIGPEDGGRIEEPNENFRETVDAVVRQARHPNSPMKLLICALAVAGTFLSSTMSAQELRRVQAKTENGIIEGIISPDGEVRTFKGIPFAAPPVGELRWKAPQPVESWSGVRQAVDFAPRPMQARIFDDMVFKDAGPSEDCLYLNLWMPEKPKAKKLPVMVWIYGGGFVAGATSEPRQDGGMLCKRDVLVVTVGYRLGVFGFLALPELSKESGYNASGNYGLMDQIAALQWVKRNIATFGGDPDNVTIFGESAGSFSVSALMASPQARGLFHKAIGQSGAFLGDTLPARSLREAEEQGREFVKAALGTESLAELRKKSADELLAATAKPGSPWFSPIIDGHVMPDDARAIYAAGKQARVPLLAGWTRDEGNYRGVFRELPPTRENFRVRATERFGARAEEFLNVYSATSDAEAKRAAQDLASDDFIGFSTWKWLEVHRQTVGAPVYRYRFDQTLPLAKDAPADAEAVAPHASDIEFVFRALWTRDLPWSADHRAVSELMADYWTNFAKNGDPNGAGLPKWPRYTPEAQFPVMHLKAPPEAWPDAHRARYEFLDSVAARKS